MSASNSAESFEQQSQRERTERRDWIAPPDTATLGALTE